MCAHSVLPGNPGDIAVMQEQAGQAEALLEPETLPLEGLAHVRVNIVNGSGEDVPEGLLVSLTGYDDMQSTVQLSGVLEEGSTIF
jgi:hypothetical protein